ncbi:hypothetical protein BDV26DRAFT_277636 [Aspergillus bertholletiae]|uniref:Alpha/Beta hydrolase protein n=1 Tax=Aspergillus bertholletiae TaxID=1226010 RepID=A0A5N7BN58_9EURO|nr:hypothetical protein BDV26DRAFT_277636 [Aspergillus bertholletiae]
MYLSSPTHSFTIPSLHDETQLDCRLYLPSTSSLQPETIRGAIVAHPYAPLGGCYDDPVVSFVGGELLKNGYIVGTFNFRGAGNSEGRTSWTAKPELADYVSFYGFMLCYLHSLRLQELSQRGDGSILGGATVEESDTLDRAGVHLILGGYSYGSLIASHLPGLDIVTDIFKNITAGTQIHQILQCAAKLSAPLEDNDLIQERDLAVKKPFDISGTYISYLLVSPLLPPLNLLLTFFSTMSLDLGAHRQLHLCK